MGTLITEIDHSSMHFITSLELQQKKAEKKSFFIKQAEAGISKFSRASCLAPLIFLFFLVFVIKEVQPGFSPSNLNFSLENWASSTTWSKTARFFMVINWVHGCPIFMTIAQVASRNTRCRNKWNLFIGAASLVFNITQSTLEPFLH